MFTRAINPIPPRFASLMTSGKALCDTPTPASQAGQKVNHDPLGKIA
jgi:hypothetical protein